MYQPLKTQRTETEQCLEDITRIYQTRTGMPVSINTEASIEIIVQNENLIAQTSEGIMTSAVAPYITPYLDQKERTEEKLPYEVRNAILTMENSVLDSHYGPEGAEKIKDRVLNLNKVLQFRKTSSPDTNNQYLPDTTDEELKRYIAVKCV